MVVIVVVIILQTVQWHANWRRCSVVFMLGGRLAEFGGAFTERQWLNVVEGDIMNSRGNRTHVHVSDVHVLKRFVELVISKGTHAIIIRTSRDPVRWLLCCVIG